MKIKRGLKSNLPTLSEGEPALTTDSKEMFIGSNGGNLQVALKNYVDYCTIGTANNPRQITQNTDGKNILSSGWNICRTTVNAPESDGEYYVLVLNPYSTLLRQIWINIWNNNTYSRQCNITNNWTWTSFAQL